MHMYGVFPGGQASCKTLPPPIRVRSRRGLASEAYGLAAKTDLAAMRPKEDGGRKREGPRRTRPMGLKSADETSNFHPAGYAAVVYETSPCRTPFENDRRAGTDTVHIRDKYHFWRNAARLKAGDEHLNDGRFFQAVVYKIQAP